MARNTYPLECQRTIDQFFPLAARLAVESGLTLDDLRQEIAVAWLVGLDPRAAVPAAVGVRRLHGSNEWKSKDLHVAARRAGNEDNLEAFSEMPRPKPARGSVTAEIAADAGVGLRAAQKRLMRQRERAAQGDLFSDHEVQNG